MELYYLLSELQFSSVITPLPKWQHLFTAAFFECRERPLSLRTEQPLAWTPFPPFLWISEHDIIDFLSDYLLGAWYIDVKDRDP